MRRQFAACRPANEPTSSSSRRLRSEPAGRIRRVHASSILRMRIVSECATVLRASAATARGALTDSLGHQEVAMRHLIVAFSFVVASGLFSAASAQPPSSPNTDRPGGDYSNFEIGVPPACRDACM